MSNKQQTAVEWFHQKTWALKIQLEKGEISIGEYANTYATLYEQAKAMHRQEIVNAVDGFPLENRNLNGIEYYEQTYGGNK
jgi:hypothetical protein